MNKLMLSAFVLMGLGIGNLAQANSPINIAEVGAGSGIYRGGNSDHKMKEEGNVTDFNQLCDKGITMVINVYARFPLRQAATCADGHTISYFGASWSSGRPEDTAVAELQRGGKVFIHCMWGIDASNFVAHIVAAKAGVMTPEDSAQDFIQITRKGSLGAAKYQQMASDILARSR